MLFTLMLAALPLHSRLVTTHGPVHVSIPPRGGAVTVVYVHGFWTNVDDAWVQHRLPEQLEASGVDAAFIAVEAPSGPGQAISWSSLPALLAEVERQTGVTLPQTVIAVGHSGAYRTLSGWVSCPRLKSVVLLDAFYGGAAPWERFLAGGGTRTLHVVARATAAKSAPFCARHAEVKCEDSKLSHMEIVTSGEVLPRVLREAAAALKPAA